MNSRNVFLNKAIFKFLLAFLIIGSFLVLLWPFALPIIMGGVLAFALYPVTSYLRKKGFKRQSAIQVMLVFLFAILLVPTLVFILRGASVLTEFFKNQDLLAKIKNPPTEIISKIEFLIRPLGMNIADLQKYTGQILEKAASFTINLFSQVLAQVPHLFLFSVILLLSIYFFLSKSSDIKNSFEKTFGFKNENSDRFIEVLQSSCKEIFLTNVFTGIIQAFIVTLGSLLFGVGDWFLVYFITFIASFIPLVGAGPIALILSIYSFIQGDNTAGIGMLVVTGISGASDNIIRPYLASFGEIEVPASINFISVIGGVMAFGLAGLFLGPLIATMTFGLVPLIVEDMRNSEADES